MFGLQKSMRDVEGRRVCNLVSHPISICLRLPHLDFLVAPSSPRLPLHLCTSVERLSFPSVSHEYTHHHTAPSLKLPTQPPNFLRQSQIRQAGAQYQIPQWPAQ
jgi:hypothetical protein